MIFTLLCSALVSPRRKQLFAALSFLWWVPPTFKLTSQRISSQAPLPQPYSPLPPSWSLSSEGGMWWPSARAPLMSVSPTVLRGSAKSEKNWLFLTPRRGRPWPGVWKRQAGDELEY